MIFKLLGGGRQFLVAAGTEEQQLIAVCEQAMAVSESPESVAVSLPSKGALFDMICRTREFTLAVPPRDAADRVAKCLRAQKSSRFVDMFSECSLTPGRAQKIRAPIIEEAEVNLECRLSTIVACGDRSLVIGDVVHLGINEEKKDEKQDERPKDPKTDENAKAGPPDAEKSKTAKVDEKSKPEKEERPKPDAKEEKYNPNSKEEKPKADSKDERREEKPAAEKKDELAKEEKQPPGS